LPSQFTDQNGSTTLAPAPIPVYSGFAIRHIRRAKRYTRIIDIDLFRDICGVDLATLAQQHLTAEYAHYTERVQKTHGGRWPWRLHSHFNRSSIWVEVAKHDESFWFELLLDTLNDESSVDLVKAAIGHAD
jgi:hypothetical protein